MLLAQNLRKQYSTVLAVDDVSLNVQRGKIFGLIGPNGAGKSSTIRMLLNITKPDAGTVTYDGRIFSSDIPNIIGYLPEERGLYKKNGLLDTIVYFASLKGLHRDAAKKKAMEWLDRFGLQSYAKRKVEELSKGNQQKVQFITAILHDPVLVVLDEPFSGLDPVNQIVMKDILQELKNNGKAVIFSTHQMESAEKLCDEICLINRGKIVLEGTIPEIKKRYGSNTLHIGYEGNGSFLSQLPFVEKATVYENFAELTIKGSVMAKDIFKEIAPKLEIRKLEFVEPSLNSIFLDVVGTSVEHIEHEKAETQSQTPTAVKSTPEIKRQQFSVVVGILTAFVGLLLALNGKDTWVVAGAGALVSVVSFLKIQHLKKQLRKETDHE